MDFAFSWILCRYRKNENTAEKKKGHKIAGLKFYSGVEISCCILINLGTYPTSRICLPWMQRQHNGIFTYLKVTFNWPILKANRSEYHFIELKWILLSWLSGNIHISFMLKKETVVKSRSVKVKKDSSQTVRAVHHQDDSMEEGKPCRTLRHHFLPSGYYHFTSSWLHHERLWKKFHIS